MIAFVVGVGVVVDNAVVVITAVVVTLVLYHLQCRQ